MLILGELQRLEDLSSEYKAILILISKRIRRDLWQCGKNDVMLYKMLNECGKQLDMAYKGPDQYMEQDFTDYILSLKSYSLFVFRFCVRPPPNSATPRSEYKVNKIFCFDKVAEKALYLMSERLTGPHPIRLGLHPAFAYL